VTRSEETYLNWIRGSENGRATGIYWMAQGMIDRLGEEEGIELFIKQIYMMGEHWADQRLRSYRAQGKENSLENFVKDSMSDDVVYSFAWEGGLREFSEHEAVIEWTECPIAAGFKDNGPKGVEIGEIFCNHVDNASTQKYNPKYECVRESSLNKDGLCRLHFKLKE
jgi:L-2-amino-thiazoline-4-carboxylic acid hydrolase